MRPTAPSIPPPRPLGDSVSEMRAAVEALSESERRIRAARELDAVEARAERAKSVAEIVVLARKAFALAGEARTREAGRR